MAKRLWEITHNSFNQLHFRSETEPNTMDEWTKTVIELGRESITECKIFSVPKDLSKLFLATDNRINTAYHRLPYNMIFIDALLNINSYYVRGLIVWTSDNTDINYLGISCKSPKLKAIPHVLLTGSTLGEPKGDGFSMTDKIAKDNHSLIMGYIANFLNYIEDKDVTVRYKPKKEHRRWKGVPKYTVRINKKVIRYIQRLKSKGFQFSHSFGVRGFWRHYQHDRYVNMKGQRQWIAPQIRCKDKGEPIEKEYLLT